MKALGKGSVASIIKVGLHVLGVILWIALVGIVLAALAYAAVFTLALNGTIPTPDEMPAWQYVLPALVIGVFWLGASILIVRRLQRLFQSFTSGEPFKRENATHLRVIWITMLVMEVMRLVMGAAILALMHTYGFPDEPNAHFEHDGIDLMPWFSILILIVLAEVFREGARLREEQELTI